jgi:hypothetical protein
MNLLDGLSWLAEGMGAVGLIAGFAIIATVTAIGAAVHSRASGARLRRVTDRYVELQAQALRRGQG